MLKTQSAEGPFFTGKEFTLADVAIAPFLFRTTHAMKEKIGSGYTIAEGQQVLDALEGKDPKYERFAKYVKAVCERSSVKETWAEVCLVCSFVRTA